MLVVPFVSSPQGQELPFIANKLHSVQGRMVQQRMLYPSQALVAAAIADLPTSGGALSAVRRSMAVQYGAEATCPVTTQRLLRDIAAAAVETWNRGDRSVTPFWRVVDPETATARSIAGGPAFIRARRAEDAG